MRIAILLFPGVTQLDLTGPLEVLGRMPDAAIDLVWKDLEPVRADGGLRLLPTATLARCGEPDMLLVPGGPGVNALMADEAILDFLRDKASGARWIGSVCTGALVLGAAGLLRGRRATTHWLSHDLLAVLGAVPVQDRVVFDPPLVTGGGVTAGIDFAFAIVARECGEDVARAVQLQIEYAPAPPFDGGRPDRAPPGIVGLVRAAAQANQVARRRLAEQAASRFA
jgi:cyclohexyl-isocyanide hydratase